jgi:acyl-ACP thioesterase
MAGTYSYRVEPGDVDASGRARVRTIGDLVLQAAGDDADMLGFGVSDLNIDGASWVLSRMAVEMQRLPARGEEVGVYTWVSDYGRLFTTRNMTLSCGEGEVGAAVTQWAMIDLATRRPLDLSALSNKGTSLVDRQPPIGMPRKVGGNTQSGSSGYDGFRERPYTVVYSDIDFNGHVNSMKYLEWMIDTLPPGVAESFGALRLDINYIHEARLGDTLTICYGEDPGGAHIFDIKNVDGVSVCRAIINN